MTDLNALIERPELPVWTDEALTRLIGVRDGYIHSLLTVRMMIHRFDSIYTGRFNPRHIRKIERRDAITKPLREIEAKLEADLRSCQETYRRELERARTRTARGKSGAEDHSIQKADIDAEQSVTKPSPATGGDA